MNIYTRPAVVIDKRRSVWPVFLRAETAFTELGRPASAQYEISRLLAQLCFDQDYYEVLVDLEQIYEKA